MKVYIVWNAVFYDGEPLRGVCVEDNTKEKDETGMPTGSRWMYFMKRRGNFNLYSLSDEEIEILKDERKYHESTLGKIINHDMSYSGDLGEPYGEMKEINMFNPKGENFVETISFKDIINPNPYQIVMES